MDFEDQLRPTFTTIKYYSIPHVISAASYF